MSDEKLDILRHSAAHLLAAAVAKLYPEAKFGVGPVIENGFYYDILTKEPITEAKLAKIEKTMKKIAQTNPAFEVEEMPIDEAIKMFKKMKQDFKVELLTDLKKKGTTKISEEEAQDVGDSPDKVTIYKTGDFVDLCRGPHVKSAKEIKVFKLTSVAGAYWRGSEKNPQLTRVYGTAFTTKKELDEYLKILEEAKERDHRKIGKEQEIFMFDDLVGKGLPMWLPKGTIVKDLIEKMVVDKENQAGYQRVTTPHLAKKELYETSGHLPYYKDDMYPAMEMDDGTYHLRAMNCPHHHLIFRHGLRSYRDMPVRLAEYGTCYRNELSGALAGLLRVRMLSMNDAHIYCTKEQIKEEVKGVMNLIIDYFNFFGFEDYWFRLSLWSPEHKDKYIDQPENWKYAEKVLREVLKEMKVKFVEAENEAAFYGPKIDGQFRSVIGREETLSTVQLDFLAKERFGLKYVDEKGKENGEVFVIHRAPLSTHERLIAFLLEHYAGAWPVWLAPVQVRFASVGEGQIDHVNSLVKEYKAKGVRAEGDVSSETVGNKIRKAAKEKIPFTVVIGDKELDGGDYQVRVFGQEDQLNLPKDELADYILSQQP